MVVVFSYTRFRYVSSEDFTFDHEIPLAESRFLCAKTYVRLHEAVLSDGFRMTATKAGVQT